jgi:hypothetical protein
MFFLSTLCVLLPHWMDADQNLFFSGSHPAGNPQRKVELFLIARQAPRSLRSKYTVSAETVFGVKLQAILVDVGCPGSHHLSHKPLEGFVFGWTIPRGKNHKSGALRFPLCAEKWKGKLEALET